MAGPFDGILEPDERILWSGQPRQGLIFGFLEVYALVLSVFGLGLIYRIAVELTRQDAWNLSFFSILIVFLACGAIYMGFARPLVSAAARRGKYYAVTDRRILSLNTFLLRNLGEKPLDRDLAVRKYRISSDGRGTLLIGKEDELPLIIGGIGFLPQMIPQFLTFERIDNAERVASLIRRQAREAAF
ncbi:MAG: hypothetical protein ACLFV8_06340 [Alphaproteobacteria bacterium]